MPFSNVMFYSCWGMLRTPSTRVVTPQYGTLLCTSLDVERRWCWHSLAHTMVVARGSKTGRLLALSSTYDGGSGSTRE